MTRLASEIGAGLAAARDARPIRPGERIHVVGAAGAGASGAALLAHAAGALVSGCDPGAPSPYTLALDAAGVPVAPAHDPAHVATVPPPGRLAVTKALTSIDPDHPELAAARTRDIPLEPWQQVVADAAARRRLVGVAGTHGKSTTAGWLVHALAAVGEDPSAFVGALLPAALTGGVPSTARWGHGPAFVVEADEYAGNFDPYRPHVAVVTSVEWDHPDVFADERAVVDAFEGWLRRMPERDAGQASPGAPGPERHDTPIAVINVEHAAGRELAGRLAGWHGAIVATALVDAAPRRVAGFVSGIEDEFATDRGPATALVGRIARLEPESTLLELYRRGSSEAAVIRLPSAGRHNAANALAVVGAAEAVGIPVERIALGLASFPGVGRRLERRGEAAGVVVYDDYGHHPTAIRETIGAIRQREPGRRVWAVYEPLTYHRTAALLDAFAEALAGADAAAVADIWAGRDPDTTIASAAGLATAVAALRPAMPVAAPGSVEATAAWLAGEVRPGDAVLVMGGGRSYRIAELLLEHLERRA